MMVIIGWFKPMHPFLCSGFTQRSARWFNKVSYSGATVRFIHRKKQVPILQNCVWQRYMNLRYESERTKHRDLKSLDGTNPLSDSLLTTIFSLHMSDQPAKITQKAMRDCLPPQNVPISCVPISCPFMQAGTICDLRLWLYACRK